MTDVLNLLGDWAPIVRALVLLLVGVATAWLLHAISFAALRRFAQRTDTVIDDVFVERLTRPGRLVVLLVVAHFVVPLLGLSARLLDVTRHLLSIALIVVVVWVTISLLNVLQQLVVHRFDVSLKDNLRARTIHTQVRVFKRVVAFIIIFLGVAAVLMTFDRVRQLGTTLLASAGVMGLVAGIAAQRTLSNLFAAVQIAITQPIRVDDVVIVEGEWGRIEEITFTYVVVRVWDLRRVILPISYFVEKPFQNWTRVSADILGTVMIYADYTVPVQAVREELLRILKGSELWDKKVAGLQVTEVREQTVELRALMSAHDSGLAWDLRCLVREKLLAFLQANYPQCLPRVRAELREAKGSAVDSTQLT